MTGYKWNVVNLATHTLALSLSFSHTHMPKPRGIFQMGGMQFFLVKAVVGHMMSFPSHALVTVLHTINIGQITDKNTKKIKCIGAAR